MKRNAAITYLFLSVFISNIHAQEINFGQYAANGIILTNVSSNSILDYGQLFSDAGLIQIQLPDPEVVVFSIEAEYDKDVFVTITAPPVLLLDPGNTLPYTLRWAYANSGSNSIGQAQLVSGETARFPVLARGSRPPAPPPTPAHESYTTPTATAFLYIYGDIYIGSVAAGSYTGTIDIAVSYE